MRYSELDIKDHHTDISKLQCFVNGDEVEDVFNRKWSHQPYSIQPSAIKLFKHSWWNTVFHSNWPINRISNMINELKNKYENFSDALVLSILYQSKENNKIVDVTIKCMNKLNDYAFEIIKLSFIDVISFQFVETENQSSTVINAALLHDDNNSITFDFFPLIFRNSDLRENDSSDFKIKCKSIRYMEVDQ